VRITSNSIAAKSYTNLQASLARSERLQEQLSSGKQLSGPADAPGQAASALQLRNSLKVSEQYVRNADDGLAWLGAADTALQSVSTQLRRVRELAVRGASTGSNNALSNAAMATEVQQIRDGLLDTANTTYLGRPIFGGTVTGSLAFQENSPLPVTYVGDAGTVQRRIGPNAQVRADVSGTAAFGTPPASVFDVLNTLVNNLLTNPTAVGTDIAAIDTRIDAVLASLSDVGSRVNRTESLRQISSDQALALQSSLSELEDIDLPGTIVALKLQETAYQAALSATARVIQPSLLDWLR